MAVAAVNSIIGDVMLMAERDRLIYGSADLGDIRRAYVQLQDHEQQSESKERPAQRESREAIRTASKDLCHYAFVLLID